MIDFVKVMSKLAQRRPIFHSEADFQHALAWELHSEFPKSQIRLEFRPFPNERIYLDLWCELAETKIAIELKCAAKLMAASVNNEQFELRNHGAQDLTRYDFLKDIVRLERVNQAIPNCVTAAIMLTNDPLLWSPSRRSVPTIDTNFRIHEGRVLTGLCAWHETAGKGTTVGRTTPLELHNSYDLQWRDFSSVAPDSGTF